VGEWMEQIPVKLPKETVARLDLLRGSYPFWVGRSTFIRALIEKQLHSSERITAAEIDRFVGLDAQYHVDKILTESGRKVLRQPFTAPFDLLVDGWRIDVKCASLGKRNGKRAWRIRTDRRNCDYYIVRLEDYFGPERALHLLMDCPKVKQICFYGDTICNKYSAEMNAFDAFRRGAHGRRTA